MRCSSISRSRSSTSPIAGRTGWMFPLPVLDLPAAAAFADPRQLRPSLQRTNELRGEVVGVNVDRARHRSPPSSLNSTNARRTRVMLRLHHRMKAARIASLSLSP